MKEQFSVVMYRKKYMVGHSYAPVIGYRYKWTKNINKARLLASNEHIPMPKGALVVPTKRQRKDVQP
jgi:hypothetical protein